MCDIESLACENISKILDEQKISTMQADVELAVQQLLKALKIDTTNDPNTLETAKRVAKMYVREVFWGRYAEMPKVTTFPNTNNLNELFTVGPITVRSACSHHLVPFIGYVWVGVIPGEKLLGLSKFARITQWVMARPHIQEEAVQMLADTLEEFIEPKGLAVVMKAKHLCMSWRGVQEDQAEMTSSIVRGLLKNHEPRSEFFNLIKVHN